jgi:diketogulonate reductase-like aldo/keto reductase
VETFCPDEISVIGISVPDVPETPAASVSETVSGTVSAGVSDSDTSVLYVSEKTVTEAVVSCAVSASEAEEIFSPLLQEESMTAQSKAYVRKIFLPL